MLRATLYLLATVLLVAAVAKLWLLLSSPFADLQTGYPYPVLWLAVVVELGLVGLVAAVRRPIPLIWLAYWACFGVLLVVSSVRWALGFTTCDCFGAIQLPIWMTPLFNASAVLVLTVWGPGWREVYRGLASFCRGASSAARRPRYAGYLSGVVLGGVCLVGLGMGMVPGNGSRIFQSPPIAHQRVVLAGLQAGQESPVAVKVRNVSAQPVEIVGNTRSCSCISLLEGRPRLAPKETLELNLRVRPAQPGPWRQRVVYYLDHPQQDRLVVDLVGIVVPQ